MESKDTKLPCADKMAFDSKKEAVATAVTAQWQHGGKLRAYQCKYCQLWHLASTYEEIV